MSLGLLQDCGAWLVWVTMTALQEPAAAAAVLQHLQAVQKQCLRLLGSALTASLGHSSAECRSCWDACFGMSCPRRILSGCTSPAAGAALV